MTATLALHAWAYLSTQGGNTSPRPLDAPEAHSPGLDSERILIFGTGLAAGWGVSSHDLALPGALARALSARTRRGTDVRLVASPRGLLRTAKTQLAQVDLRRLNAVVVIYGVDDAIHFTSETAWRRDLTRLLHHLEQQTSDDTYVYVHGIQSIRSIPIFDSVGGSIANLHARALNRITKHICQTIPRSIYVPLHNAPFLDSARLRSSTDYRNWGESLSIPMAGRLTRVEQNFVLESMPQQGPMHDNRHSSSSENQTRLDRIVALAQQSFGTSSAVFAVQDQDRLVSRSNAGPKATNENWSDSLAAKAVRSHGAFIVADTLATNHKRLLPGVVSEPRIRFFAGFPIESPSGERIGVLCVFDPIPRSIASFDSVLLRQLALMIQDELHVNGEFVSGT